MYFASLEKHFREPGALPYDSPREYGALLDAVVVKYAAEASRASEVLGAPVHVVPNGIDPGPAPRVRQAARALVTVCRIAPQKKLEDLFAALRLVRTPWELRVVGDAETGSEDYASGLRAMTRDLPVQWVGERADVRAELDRADAFVMISEPAGCPNASLEAMAAGLPIVATDFGGVREQVLDGETGFLTPRGDAESFARAIERLDPSMGLRGRDHVEQNFSLDAMVASYRNLCGV
jgi:glycosyltransferase involved in cell wall biosynthesis